MYPPDADPGMLTSKDKKTHTKTDREWTQTEKENWSK